MAKMPRPLLSHSIMLLIIMGFVASAAASGCDSRSPPVVAVDIGHYLKRSGAMSARGVSEFSFNRNLADSINNAFKNSENIDSVLINSDGKVEDLKSRAAQAAKSKANLFVSIHHDSVQEKYLQVWSYDGIPRRYSDKFKGFSLFVSRKNMFPDVSLRVATSIANEFLARGLQPTLHHAEPISGENRPLADPVRGIYWFDDLAVLRSARMPAILIEAGVIVHRDEEITVQTPIYHDLVAHSLVEAINSICHELPAVPTDEDAANSGTVLPNSSCTGRADCDAAGRR